MTKPIMKVRMEPNYLAALTEMAAEAGLSRTRLIASLLAAVLDDDAAAHGRKVPADVNA